jgi:hypothetical protein
MSDLVNVIQRWESLGLLEGLTLWEKEEMAQIYDNATKLLLSERSVKLLPQEISEIYDNVYIPVCRRLYRRVGGNFDISNMMSSLLDRVNEKGSSLLKTETDDPIDNPIVKFCVDFADSYEDEFTSRNTLSDEEYSERIDYLLIKLKEIFLNEKMVSHVNRDNTEWVFKFSEGEKSKQQTRYWNQKLGRQLINSFLSDINKGNY